MTQKAAICIALLQGDVLSIMTAFKQFNCTNLPREISRSVEKEFGVQISRTKRVFVSDYGEPGFFYQYRLNRDADYNQIGIAKMKESVKLHSPKSLPKSTIARQYSTFKSSSIILI